MTPTLRAQRTGFHDVLTLPAVVGPSDAPTTAPGGTSTSAQAAARPARVDLRVARSQTLLADAAATSDPQERERLRSEVVDLHLGLSRAIASRYRGRGMDEDDLGQAASAALMTAARSFDPSQGVEFLSHAVLTLKRALEDRVPRRN